MLETVITLKPKSQWRHAATWYSGWALGWLAAVLRHITPDRISQEQLVNQMTPPCRCPAWPIPAYDAHPRAASTRLHDRFRTPLGAKTSGADVGVIEQIGTKVKPCSKMCPARAASLLNAPAAGHFLDIERDREALAVFMG